MRVWCLIFVLLVFCRLASAQQCPKLEPDGPDQPSATQTLRGQLVFHDDIRQWFELKLDKPRCGQSSIQLVRIEKSWTPLQTLRGCRVYSVGALGDSETGYYSLDTYQSVDDILPDGACTTKAPFPDYSKVKPDPHVTHYGVEMDLNYRPGDHPVVFHVTNGGKTLTPWQVYASYDLTGDFALYGECGEGFVVDHVSGTAQAHPQDFGDGRASYDPEGAAAAGVHDLKLFYTCIRTK